MAFTEGRHEVEVLSTALSDPGSNKTPSINVQFAGDEGNTITAYLYVSDKAWPHTEEKLKTLGWDPMKHAYRFEDLNLDPSPIKGAKAQITTESEVYEGKSRMKVKFINPPGGGIERMEPAAASSFAEKLRQRILNGVQRQASATGATPAGPSDSKSPPTDEELNW